MLTAVLMSDVSKCDTEREGVGVGERENFIGHNNMSRAM